MFGKFSIPLLLAFVCLAAAANDHLYLYAPSCNRQLPIDLKVIDAKGKSSPNFYKIRLFTT